MTEEEKLKERQEFSSKGASPYADVIINRVINNKEPCVLVLPTGAGKSTVIPFAFIQAGYRVMIAEPTVAMCQNIIRSFKVMFPSVKIGSAFAREINIPKDAKLIVCTNGYLRRRLLNYVRNGVCASIDMTDIIMLDEVHFGLLDTHVIVTIWFYCSTKFASTARMPRLILSSATVKDNVLFSRVFSPCVILPAEKFATSFPIDIVWSKDFRIDSNERFVEMGNLIKSIHESTPTRERILAFIPGNAEQQMVLNTLGSQDYDLVAINSKSGPEDLAPLDRAQDDRRLIILTTPSADAGLTIPNLKHVVDSLLIKNAHTQPNGSQSLITEFASKQLFYQRKGRVGRREPGTYYPMCTEAFFNSASMPDTYTPELYRLPIYQTIIELVSIGIPVEEVFKIYNIPRFSETIDQMIRWGLVRRSPTSGILFASSGGNFMTITNIDNPRLAGVLYGWIRLSKPIVTGVILSQLIANFTSQMLKIPIFEVTSTTGGKIEKLKIDFMRKNYGRFLGKSDVHTAIKIWNALQKEGGVSSTERWCNINNLQFAPVRTTLKNIQQILPAAIREAQRFVIRESLPLTPIDNEDWIIDEKKALPTLRSIMQYIYFDEIANRSSLPSIGTARYVARDGSVLTPSGGFNQQTADPDANIDFPLKVIVIGKRTTQYGKLQLTQFLDIDNQSEIEDISSETLRERLGIFKHYTR